ncbi:MFS transporter [Trinickia sp. NRRL B-1857]|uniref:MFS transporter n=1 Tax=Trinickia sp. NRRL B-1857 TaxID=3162879 RepID=UPI003D271442
MHPSYSSNSVTAHHAADARRIERRAAVASIIGTTIEWYDFFIYGTAAALVFPKLFFAHGNAEGLMASFATVFVGFVSRPLGGALFAHMGDRVGRKSTLVATLTLMGVATLCVGLLPTAETLGPLAGWLLVGLRFLQGIGVGGEWGGAVLLSMESHTGNRRGLMASLPNVGVPLGLVISVIVWSACSHWAGDALLNDAWRIPFLASGVMLAVGLLIRFGVPETRDFIEANKVAKRTKGPIAEAIRTEWRAILLCALIRPSEQTAFYTLTTFAVLYGAKYLGLGKEFILNAVLIAAIVACFALPCFGYIADRIGRCKTYSTGAVCMMLFAFPYFALLNTRLPAAVIVGTVVIMVIHASMYGSQASFIAESFPAHIRYSGASLGYQGASIIAGGPAPMISLWLFETFHTVYAVAAYLSFVSFVSAVASLYLGRSKSAMQARDLSAR